MRKLTVLAMSLFSFVATADPVNLYRAYSDKASDHFYTTSMDEMFQAVNGIYNYEGVAGKCLSTQEAGAVPLYRLWGGGKLSDHFYTTSWQERDIAIARGTYTDEGVACYVYMQQQPGTCAFHRLWNGTDHFYTLSWQETLTAIGTYKYTYEGVAGYLFSSYGACPN
ncbi:hypothetical protein [Stigmatella aurantiaca]|uniref:Conserved uncharacterized protein n=1 Tax=Stigmatella aurantiaca (strain DW4/3-1) TaxID=378806 RepID=E3FEI5_STIAD|nr:hypothetical protein [Stigmatella aurantiaca]ADO75141.1 conserved uncharacterized protein [Stigmatella aurantiaca DW4/3-1]